ncbi:Fur family transcriptional regulator [Sinisalibacter lacisalsi]|uniref:Ferric uptake regulation protein n=1 Tax=Sinisalibacter lacisalsi TaxID=1526570 RepID=A0ABQ1QUF6_9RHOB|nr:Fur family transcriptional regulator [Sinisalibacter lacisalsi]GGD44306.1 transcriptional repressor [Sinisalibacter lacisalsi]
MNKPFQSSDGDDLLRDAGLRVTRQRQAIAQVLIEAEDHPNAEQVLARAREHDESVSQATAYRTLSVLSEKGLLHTHTFDKNVMRFELADRPHHDHLIDVETGEIREFVSAEIERLQRKIAKAYGYEIVAHRLELFCRKAAPDETEERQDTADLSES